MKTDWIYWAYWNAAQHYLSDAIKESREGHSANVSYSVNMARDYIARAKYIRKFYASK